MGNFPTGEQICGYNNTKYSISLYKKQLLVGYNRSMYILPACHWQAHQLISYNLQYLLDLFLRAITWY